LELFLLFYHDSIPLQNICNSIEVFIHDNATDRKKSIEILDKATDLVISINRLTSLISDLQGQTVELGNWLFTIVEADARTIHLIRAVRQ
jgi:hypothetical protein